MGYVKAQRPRPISREDDTSSFDCGVESLNRYLSDLALTNRLNDLSRCYVCVDTDSKQVVGYYTLSAVGIHRGDLPGRLRRNAPDPVPAVLIGRLAIDLSARDSGLGRLLVRDAVLSTLAAADLVGVQVLLVHAIDREMAAFYEKLGFRSSPTDPLHLYLHLGDARESIDS